MAISIKFPFQETQQGGVFKPNEITVEAIQTNLISLLTMKRRHRPMQSNLYSPLWDYIFEQWDEISQTNLKRELIEKITEYITTIEVVDIVFKFDETKNLLEVKVVYSITELGGLQNEVNVVVPVEPGNEPIQRV